jgi:hypothetical protein
VRNVEPKPARPSRYIELRRTHTRTEYKNSATKGLGRLQLVDFVKTSLAGLRRIVAELGKSI